jgi:predicted RNA methylase
MFPEKEGVNYANLRMTVEGEYSMTKRADGKKILQKMVSVMGSTQGKHITDLTGNVGGDTILFGLNFASVDSIEYNQDNFDVLKHNVKTYKLNNVNLHFGDSTKIYKWHTDVLYLDPPWGGPEYKTKENMDLFLGRIRIDNFLKKIVRKSWKPSYIFIKLPRNYNFERLENLELPMHNFTIRGFNLVALEVV